MGYKQNCERGLDHPDSVAARQQRINDARVIKSSETALFNGALQAIRSTTLTPERVMQLISTVNASLDSNPQFQVGYGNYGVRCAVLECFCAIEAEVVTESEAA